MKSYEQGFKINLKRNDSPITTADLLSNQVIIKELKKISNYPIISGKIQLNTILERITKNTGLLILLMELKILLQKMINFQLI